MKLKRIPSEAAGRLPSPTTGGFYVKDGRCYKLPPDRPFFSYFEHNEITDWCCDVMREEIYHIWGMDASRKIYLVRETDDFGERFVEMKYCPNCARKVEFEVIKNA